MYAATMARHFGQPLERWPTFCGKKLDVKTLYDQVSIRRRGFENVKTNKQWKEQGYRARGGSVGRDGRDVERVRVEVLVSKVGVAV